MLKNMVRRGTTDSSSDVIQSNSAIDQYSYESPLDDDDHSSDDIGGGWQVVKKKEKSIKPKIPKKKKATKQKNGHVGKRVKNQTKTYGKPIAHIVEEDKGIEEVIEHSFSEECAYCQVNDVNCIVQCGNCKKWFCNTATKNGSHIISHLVKAGHNEVVLHQKSIKDGVVPNLGCFHCQCQNIFDLGFVTNEADAYNVLLCRIPCGLREKSGLNDVDLSLCDWQPIIKDRHLLPWLVEKKSSKVNLQRERLFVSEHKLEAIEKKWKDDPYAAFDDLKLERQDQVEPECTKLRYEDAEEFERIFSRLVHLEEDEDELRNKLKLQDKTKIRWERSRTKTFVAYTAFFVIENPPAEINLSLNKELCIRYRGGNPEDYWSRVGHIVKTPRHIKDEIGVQFRINRKLTEYTTDFIIENVFNSSSYARMCNAMDIFCTDEDSMSEYIYESVLGRKIYGDMLGVHVPEELSVKGLPTLNSSQIYAVKRALRRPVCIIQGPPGTGKTVTSASLVYHLVEQGNGTVLVCAPSNIAVDNLTIKIHETGLNVVRLFAKAREDTDSSVLFLGLHVRICKMDGWNDIPELVKLHRERQLAGELQPCDEKRYNFLKWPFEKKLLDEADVICSTCVSAGDVRLNAFTFHSVLIDECTQATEPECLIPLVKGARQVTFVGDHHQLGPVVISKPANEAGLSTSLFERLVVLGYDLVQLKVQYRMHPDLSRFPSATFYENLLKDGVDAATHKIQNDELERFWPKTGTPMLFYSASTGKEELWGTSYLNQFEAALVEQFICHLLSFGVEPNQIGVITPYQAQRGFISQYLEFSNSKFHDLLQEIEVASVDAFQGREKDLIIFSCVRSNDQNRIGFLSDARRLNVAITRARYGLIVIGNPKVLTKHPLWNLLLLNFNNNRALMEGPMAGVIKCNVKLNKPTEKRYFMKVNTFNAKEYFNG